MVDILVQYRRELVDRDEARKKLQSVEAAPPLPGDETAHEKKLSRHRSDVARVDDNIRKLRDGMRREAAEQRESAVAARASIAELEGLHAAGKAGEASYRTGMYRLRRRMADAETMASLLERASAAESAGEVRALESAVTAKPEGTESPEAAIERFTEPRGMDWPGVTVPERIAMLWRESKKSSSRRSILVSAAVVGVLTVVILGVVLVSGTLAPRDATDYLGKGEVLVPVLLDNAEGVRNLEFTVAYDPDILTAMSVVQDQVARLAVMQYDILKTGEVTVLVRDVMGISGSGSIVIIRFKTNEVVVEPSILEIVSLTAVDVRTMMERPVDGTDGWVNTETLDVLAPVIGFPAP